MTRTPTYYTVVVGGAAACALPFRVPHLAQSAEAGGLTSRELLATLRSFARLNLVGADIVEVAPAYDHAQITGIAAAHVGYELLSALAARKAAP